MAIYPEHGYRIDDSVDHTLRGLEAAVTAFIKDSEKSKRMHALIGEMRTLAAEEI